GLQHRLEERAEDVAVLFRGEEHLEDDVELGVEQIHARESAGARRGFVRMPCGAWRPWSGRLRDEGDTTMKKSLATLAILFVGCATGAAGQGIAAQSFAPNPSAPKWEQFCDARSYGRFNVLNDRIASLGQEGWELVAFTGVNAAFPCFKRPAP